VTIPAGQSSAALTVTPVPNHIAEDDTLVAPTLRADTPNYNLGTPLSAMVTLHNSDIAGVLLSTNLVTVNEVNSVPLATGTGTTATVTASLNSDPVGAVVLDLANNDPEKCMVFPAQLTLTGGSNGTWQTGLPFKVTSLNDYTTNGNQSFSLMVQVQTNSTDWQGKYRLLDDVVLQGTNEDDLTGPLSTPQGTPYAWLHTFQLTNDLPTATELLDGDLDGMPAWQEYIAGTDPTNTASVLHVTGLSTNTVTFMPTFSNRSYAVLGSTGLTATAEEWLPLAPFQNATGPVTWLPVTGTVSRMFYRIGVRIP
jgi:hypothetical protein